MKKITFLLVFILSASGLLFGQATDLFFSEYIEGSSNNKAIEIYNGTGAAVDLSNYELWRISNGGSWPEYTLSLSGTLADGDVFVVYNPSSGPEITAVGDLANGFASWNGDDAVGLAKDIGGTMTLIDAVGEDGPDPGSGWDVAGVTNATANHTLVRKPDICSPTTDWAASAGTNTADSEWIVYSQDDFNYIGSHTANCSGGPTPLDANFSADQTSAITGVPVNFVDLTSGGTLPYSYEWDLDGDGQFDDSTDPNPSFIYTTAGTYDVHLRVTDGDLTVDVESKLAYITVVAPIEVADIATLRAGLQGELYKITGEVVLTFQQSYRNQKYIEDASAAILIDDNAGIIITSYTIGDGITGITGTLGEYGNMLQFVPAADPGSSTSSGNSITPQVITINELFTNFENYEAELVQLLDINFTGGGGTFANFTVYPITDASKADGDFRTSFENVDYIGTTIPNNANIIGLPNSRFDGNYITSRFAADIEEIVPVILTPDFTADQTSIAVGGTVSFTDLTSGGTPPYSYEWDLDGDGQFDDSTDPNPSFQYNTAGTFDVSLRVTDAIPNTVTETKTDYITVVDIATDMVINETDADTPGADNMEFIELYDGGSGNTDLSGLVVVLYNGNGDVSYNAFDLDGYSTGITGYFVLGNAGVPNVDYIIPDNSLQNGADAIALYVGNDSDFPNGTPVTTANLLDAIVYDTYDNDDPGLLVLLNPGQPQINEGGRGDKDNHSNQRIPNGSGGQRNTDTYDQSPPTPGAVNVLIFTDWTGVVDEDWDNAGNWHNGLPDASLNATIPDVGGKAPYPVIYGTAITGALYIATGAQLTIAAGADLTTTGLFTNNGSFYMSSDAAGISASFIDQGGLAGSGNFQFNRDLFCSGSNPGNPADPFGWHYLGAPIDGLSTDNLPDYYINQWDETTGTWMNFAGTIPCVQFTPAETLDGMEAWSLNYDSQWPTYGCPQTPAGNIIQFSGPFTALHTGGYSAPATVSGGTYSGWNVYGNPYPSAISPGAFNWAGFDNTALHGVAIYDGCAGNYLYSNSANFYPYDVGPTQGFFMLALTPGSFALAGTERVHNNSQTIWKEAVTDLVTIKATGDGTSDLAYIRFMEGSEAGMDVADFPKLFSTTEGLAQIYTTAGEEKLAVNALPATEVVAMGFTSVTSGEYTISAIETSDFANVVLEDRTTGEQTNLLTDSYTFNYTVNDDPDRFFVHFTPLGTPEISASSIQIWSNDHKIYVQSPEITGDIVVFNMMGQEVIRTEIEPGLNVIPVNEINAFYVVKLVGNEVSKTGKVYLK